MGGAELEVSGWLGSVAPSWIGRWNGRLRIGGQLGVGGSRGSVHGSSLLANDATVAVDGRAAAVARL